MKFEDLKEGRFIQNKKTKTTASIIERNERGCWVKFDNVNLKRRYFYLDSEMLEMFEDWENKESVVYWLENLS